MTKYELWTLDAKLLVRAFKNACVKESAGDAKAASAVVVLQGEVMRRLNILTQMDEDERDRDNMEFYYDHPEGVRVDD